MMTRRSPCLAFGAVLFLLAVPTVLLLRFGSPFALILHAPRHLFALAVAVAWSIWCWWVAEIAFDVVRRVHRRDLEARGTLSLLERSALGIAGLILSLSSAASASTSGAAAVHAFHPAAIHHQIASATELTAPTPVAAVTYTVQPGDCLWDIALVHYGDGDAWTLIANANLGKVMQNGEVFTNPSLILPGWQLTVPADPSLTPPTMAQPIPPVPVPVAADHATIDHRRSLAPTTMVRDGGFPVGEAVLIATGVGGSLVALGLFARRRRRRLDADPFDAGTDEEINRDLASLRVKNIPLTSMAEQALWLAEADDVLRGPGLLALNHRGAMLFEGAQRIWSAPAIDLVADAPFVDHAPGILLPLGDHDETSWNLVVPPGCTAGIAGNGAGDLIEQGLALQSSWGWGSMTRRWAENAAFDDLSDDALLIGTRAPLGEAERWATVLSDAHSVVRIDDGVVSLLDLDLSFPSALLVHAPSAEESEQHIVPNNIVTDHIVTEHVASPRVISTDAVAHENATKVQGTEPTIVVRLLGNEPRIDHQGSPIDPKRIRRATELLAYLALHPGEAVTSDRLRTRVLGTATNDAASKTLFNIASALRSALGTHKGEHLFPRATTTGLYRAGPTTTTDFTTLAHYVERGDAALDDDEAMALYREGLSLITGEPLSTVLAGYEWFDAEGHRARLETIVERAASSLVSLALEHDLIALAEFALTKAHVVVPYSEALAELAIDVAGARGSLDELRRRFNELVAVIDEVDPGRSPRLAVEQRYRHLHDTITTQG